MPVDAAAELTQLLGADSVLRDAARTAPLLVDHLHRYQGRALAVVEPRTVTAVSRLLAWCNEHGVGVVPQGGNTGYCGGATPDETGQQILLSMRRLNQVRAVDAANFSMTVEAGCVLAAVQTAADAADRFFPLSLGSEGSCQIGGNLATNAGGLNVLRYGMTRDLTLGIEAVLADGRLYEGLKSLRKDNTGYDLKSLLIGSEGTLGVITAATLKLWPAMRVAATAFAAVRDPGAALKLLGRLRAAASDSLSSFELIPRIAIDLTTRFIPGVTDPLGHHHDWYVLCELTAPAGPLEEQLQRELAEAITAGLLIDAAVATNNRQRRDFWRLRESIPESQKLAGASLKHDVSVPVAALPDFILEASQWVQDHVPEGVLVCYGHAGDGNLHFNISRLDGGDTREFLLREPVINRAVHDIVTRYGGSISAEHGIGRRKREALQHYASPVKLQAMRAIKDALDPKGILNPGKLL